MLSDSFFYVILSRMRFVIHNAIGGLKSKLMSLVFCFVITHILPFVFQELLWFVVGTRMHCNFFLFFSSFWWAVIMFGCSQTC